MKYFIRNGIYMQGDMLPGDAEVTERPTVNHVWKDGAWVLDTEKVQAVRIAEIKAEIALIEEKCARDLRAVVLGKGDTADASGKTPRQYLAEYDSQIVALRSELAGL